MSAKSEAASAMDPTLRVKALIALTQELTEIFAQENTCLKARRPDGLAPFQTDKARLAAAYAQAIRQIAHDRGLVDGAGDALLEQLKEITGIFETRAREQRALLSNAQTVSEHVLRAVADEAASAGTPTSYSAGAACENAGADAPAPLAVNEQA